MRNLLRGIFALSAMGTLLLTNTAGFANPRQEAKPETKSDAQAEKPAQKSQESLASKKPFATIKATDETVTKALGAKDLEGAKKLLGKEGTFTGTVAMVYTASNNSLIILDFDKEYKTALTAKLEPEVYDKFPKIKDLEGKKILVTGKFSLYKKNPQIELTDPAQIKIIEK